MKKTILTLLCGCGLAAALLPSQAEALKVNFEPSVTFRNSYNRGYYRPRVVRQHYDEVHIYHDPYTNLDHYYYYPVTQEYVEYYPAYRSSGTDFNLKFKFK